MMTRRLGNLRLEFFFKKKKEEANTVLWLINNHKIRTTGKQNLEITEELIYLLNEIEMGHLNCKIHLLGHRTRWYRTLGTRIWGEQSPGSEITGNRKSDGSRGGEVESR